MDQGVGYQRVIASGRWAGFSFESQMGNICCDVSRACHWEETERRQRDFHFALQLLDGTIALSHGPRLWELLRAREVLCDFFAGENIYRSTREQIQAFYNDFVLAPALRQVAERRSTGCH